MALSHYLWSRTAASNATADPQVNWAEGQSPSSVNDSARAMMASAAGFRDDIAGAITTGGTSTAYTVTSYQIFSSLAVMDKMVIAFTPHTTNGATVTLNVDGLGAKPLRSAPSVELLAGTLIQGTPYVALYNNSDSAWYLQGFFGNPYNIPLGSGIDYWGTTAPNSSFVFPFGQAISRSTYSTLFSLFSTTYGSGDGTTTFNLPDCRGRITAKKDNMGGSGAGRMQAAAGGIDGTVLGGAGGADTQTLTLAQLPTGITSSGSFTSSGSTWTQSDQNVTTFSANSGASVWQAWTAAANVSRAAVTGSLAVTSNNTSGNAHTIVQPTIVCNYIMRII